MISNIYQISLNFSRGYGPINHQLILFEKAMTGDRFIYEEDRRRGPRRWEIDLSPLLCPCYRAPARPPGRYSNGRHQGVRVLGPEHFGDLRKVVAQLMAPGRLPDAKPTSRSERCRLRRAVLP